MVEYENKTIDPSVMVAKQVFGEKNYSPEEAKGLIVGLRERLKSQVYTRDLIEPKNEEARHKIEDYMDAVVEDKKDKTKKRLIKDQWKNNNFLQTLTNLNEYFFQMIRHPGANDQLSRRIQENSLRWHYEFANWIYSNFAKEDKSPSMHIVYAAFKSIKDQKIDMQTLEPSKKGDLFNLFRCIIQEAILSGLLEVNPKEEDRLNASIDPFSIVTGMKAAIKINGDFQKS